MDDLLMDKPEKPKKLKPKKKRTAGALTPKAQGINVHVNVVNTAGDGHKKTNPADDALNRLRGY